MSVAPGMSPPSDVVFEARFSVSRINGSPAAPACRAPIVPARAAPPAVAAPTRSERRLIVEVEFMSLFFPWLIEFSDRAEL
jgi:hypothetical protein